MPQLSDDAFFLLCEQQIEHRIERNAQGRIEIHPGTGGETGSRNAELVYQLRAWSRRSQGVSFDSSTMFRLPDSSMRSPDSAWVAKSRLTSLSTVERKKFIPLCPDFVIELLSPSDRLSQVQAKMTEWIANGAAAAWLIDPDRRQAFLYRPDQPTEILDNPASIEGEGQMSGFVLDMANVWDPGF